MFRNAWNTLSKHAVDVYESHFNTKFTSSWTKDIDQLLVLLKLLPAKAAGKNLASIESSFAKAEQKLIVFRTVSRIILSIPLNIPPENCNFFDLYRQIVH